MRCKYVAQFGIIRIAPGACERKIKACRGKSPVRNAKEVSEMPNVRNIIPKKGREIGTGRAMRPFTHSMEEFFENHFPSRWMEGFLEPAAWSKPSWREFERDFDVMPKVDILDKKDALLVRVEMPGIKKEDLEITIAGDRLTFEAKREFEKEDKDDNFFRHEMAYGRMFRTIQLPVEVLGDKVKAELKEGILELYLPKVEVTTPFKVKVA